MGVLMRGCRTPRHKTHSSAAVDEMAIAYLWHPWAERTIRIHEVIERPTGAVARFSLVDAAVVRVAGATSAATQARPGDTPHSNAEIGDVEWHRTPDR